jgi:pimeloyl-ACP methyl ester carboxylesterase
MSELTRMHRIEANGLEIAYLDAGLGPTVLLFHGFPDIAPTFDGLIERLTASGFRCVAPWTRGYWPTSSGRYYDVGTLVADAVALIDMLALDRVFVVGHDWGADMGYGLSAACPERVAAAGILAVPHDRALQPSRLASFDQLRRSFYMWLFQLSPLAEETVARDRFAFLRRLWDEWSPGWSPPEEHLDAVVQTFERPGVLSAALSYYRAPFDRTLEDPALDALRERTRATIEVPTILLLGDRDECLAPSMAVGSEAAFEGPYRIETLESCGHFPQLEATDRVAERLIAWFREPHGDPGG